MMNEKWDRILVYFLKKIEMWRHIFEISYFQTKIHELFPNQLEWKLIQFVIFQWDFDFLN